MITLQQASRKKKAFKKRLIRVPALKGCPSKKAVILKLRIMKPKKPNSANRKIAKVRLSSGRKILAQIPGRGFFLSEHAVVMINGKRVQDLPGIHYRLVKGVYDFTYREVLPRNQARSRYGYPNNWKKKRIWKKKTKTRKKKQNKLSLKNKKK